jgi:hypothetical protein
LGGGGAGGSGGGRRMSDCCWSLRRPEVPTPDMYAWRYVFGLQSSGPLSAIS